MYVFIYFRVKVNECITASPLPQCNCWKNASGKIQSIKDCMIAKDKDDKVKNKLDLCKKAFSTCKKFEDKAVQYVYKCKTSNSNLLATLTSLYNAQNKLTNVKNKANTIANSTPSNKRTTYISSTELITAIITFVTTITSLDVDAIGTSSTVKTIAVNVQETNVYVFTYTSVQISSAQSAATSISSVLVQESFTIFSSIFASFYYISLF